MRTGNILLRFCFVLALAGLVAGCPKKNEVDTTPDEEPLEGVGDPVFVEISIDETDEADQLELMQATAACGNLVKLEPAAMMGKMDDGQIRCLDKSLRDAERQTVKDKISRVLMADAWAKGNLHRWEAIVRRHLNDIDRSDPDLCYKFARYLSKAGAEHADETLKWADMALENRTYWEGDTHVSRVNSLYRLKATTAQKKWAWMEEEYLKNPTEQLLEDKTSSRNQAKTLAREWLEYAKSAGKDTTMAMQMCISAAGTSQFCELVTDDGP